MSLLQDRLNSLNKEKQNDIYSSSTPLQQADIFSHQNENTDNTVINSFKIKNSSDKRFRDKRASKRNNNQVIIEQPDAISEEMLEEYELIQKKAEKDKIKKENIMLKVMNYIIIAACIYIIFLIYGVFVTNYHYDNTGKIVPEVLSVSDIKESKEFNVILLQYNNCRLLYEKILLLDYRIGQGVEDTLTIAPEYEALLDEVENLSIKINALDINTKYEQLRSMMLTWVKTDVAIYLQKMSSAISKNNSDDAAVAISYLSIVYNDFSLISENIVTMGDIINGIDVTEIKAWSPEKYIDKTIKSK